METVGASPAVDEPVNWADIDDTWDFEDLPGSPGIVLKRRDSISSVSLEPQLPESARRVQRENSRSLVLSDMAGPRDAKQTPPLTPVRNCHEHLADGQHIAPKSAQKVVAEVQRLVASANEDADADELPLQRSWVFWYDERTEKWKTPTEFDSNILEIGVIKTIGDFWKYWKHLPISTLSPGASIRLFPRSLQPLWQAAENCNGGRWMIPCSKGKQASMWKTAGLMLIGETLKHSSAVNGIVLSCKRRDEYLLSVWCKHSMKDNTVREIGGELRRALKLAAGEDVQFVPFADVPPQTTPSSRGTGRTPPISPKSPPAQRVSQPASPSGRRRKPSLRRNLMGSEPVQRIDGAHNGRNGAPLTVELPGTNGHLGSIQPVHSPKGKGTPAAAASSSRNGTAKRPLNVGSDMRPQRSPAGDAEKARGAWSSVPDRRRGGSGISIGESRREQFETVPSPRRSEKPLRGVAKQKARMPIRPEDAEPKVAVMSSSASGKARSSPRDSSADRSSTSKMIDLNSVARASGSSASRGGSSSRAEDPVRSTSTSSSSSSRSTKDANDLKGMSAVVSGDALDVQATRVGKPPLAGRSVVGERVEMHVSTTTTTTSISKTTTTRTKSSGKSLGAADDSPARSAAAAATDARENGAAVASAEPLRPKASVSAGSTAEKRPPKLSASEKVARAQHIYEQEAAKRHLRFSVAVICSVVSLLLTILQFTRL